jgi:hypothetical protein
MQQMIDVKTAELEGAALDWAVAQVEGRNTRIYLCPVMDEYKVAATVPGGDLEFAWMPSIDWGQGGLLIEAHDVSLSSSVDGTIKFATIYRDKDCVRVAYQRASTRLIAVCRAIVAAKLGGVVSVPAELMP